MKPRVIVCNAVSLDGRIDGFQPDIGLFYGLVARFGEDATLAGCETLLHAPDEIPAEAPADLAPPRVEPDDKRPMLVVADSRGRLRTWHYWKQQPFWRHFAALCTDATSSEHYKYLHERHIDCLTAGTDRIDFAAALEMLNQNYGVKTVRVESGGTLNGVLLRAGLVDEVHLLMHPVLVGDAGSKSFLRTSGLKAASNAIRLQLLALEPHASDIVLASYSVMQ
ncbi:MAG: RibD family protein [Pirellulales bacterium]